jgi:predicted phosphodiesterase
VSAETIAALRALIDAGEKIPPAGRVPRDYDDAVAQWRGVIGCTTPAFTKRKDRPKAKPTKIAILADAHCPFHDVAAVEAFLKAEAGADLCILGGDTMDMYGVSRFTKYEAVPMEAELASAQWLIERLSETFPEVRVIEGNHDTPRLERMVLERLSPDAVTAIRFLTGGTLSPVEAICKQFANVQHVKNKVGRFTLSWYAQVGDLLVAHAEKYSTVPGSALRGIDDWLTHFHDIAKLKPWRVLMQAHTHAQSHLFWKADKQLVEIGCMCQTHGYQMGARLAGRPQRIGWARCEQRDGRTLPESVRLVPYGYMVQ